MLLVGFFLTFLLISSIVVLLYNRLVFRKNQVKKAFSSIYVLLKKRSDLIPKLIVIVKSYMKYEHETLTEIASSRLKAASKQVIVNNKIELENQVSRAINNILLEIEAYPDLKANYHFIRLQESLNEVEEQISAARRFYNSAVTDYNNSLEMFPTNLIALFINYRKKEYL
ncbi:LemA family protein [Scytonema sp. NUACC26]